MSRLTMPHNLLVFALLANFMNGDIRSAKEEERAAVEHGGPLAPALSGLAGRSCIVPVAAAAGKRLDARSRKELRIARYCAMLCVYSASGVCKTACVADICIKQRVLKAWNVEVWRC